MLLCVWMRGSYEERVRQTAPDASQRMVAPAIPTLCRIEDRPVCVCMYVCVYVCVCMCMYQIQSW